MVEYTLANVFLFSWYLSNAPEHLFILEFPESQGKKKDLRFEYANK